MIKFRKQAIIENTDLFNMYFEDERFTFQLFSTLELNKQYLDKIDLKEYNQYKDKLKKCSSIVITKDSNEKLHK